MFSDKRYCDIRLAIGELVMEGFEVTTRMEGKQLVIAVETDKAERTFTGLRDGSGWVVRTESVQDYIDYKKGIEIEFIEDANAGE